MGDKDVFIHVRLLLLKVHRKSDCYYFRGSGGELSSHKVVSLHHPLEILFEPLARKPEPLLSSLCSLASDKESAPLMKACMNFVSRDTLLNPS